MLFILKFAAKCYELILLLFLVQLKELITITLINVAKFEVLADKKGFKTLCVI